MQPLLKMIPRVEDSSYDCDSDNTTSYTSNSTLWAGLAATTALVAGGVYYYYWHNNTTNNNITESDTDHAEDDV